MNRTLMVLVVCGLIIAACAQSPAPRVTVSTAQATPQPATTVPTALRPTTAPPTNTLRPPTSTPEPTTAASPTVAASPTTPAVSTSSEIALEPIAEGLARPTYLTHAGDARLFVIEQPGRIRIIDASGQLTRSTVPGHHRSSLVQRQRTGFAERGF